MIIPTVLLPGGWGWGAVAGRPVDGAGSIHSASAASCLSSCRLACFTTQPAPAVASQCNLHTHPRRPGRPQQPRRAERRRRARSRHRPRNALRDTARGNRRRRQSSGRKGGRRRRGKGDGAGCACDAADGAGRDRVCVCRPLDVPRGAAEHAAAGRRAAVSGGAFFVAVSGLLSISLQLPCAAHTAHTAQPAHTANPAHTAHTAHMHSTN